MMFARWFLCGAAVMAVIAASPCCFAADDAKGEKIVFTSMAKNVGIVSMNADGSNRKALNEGDKATEVDPALSPDGKRIVFVLLDLDGKKSEIVVMSSAGKDRRTLLKSKEGQIALAPAWSPDGKKLAYSMVEIEENKPPIKHSVMVMDADGKNGKRLAEGMMPAWSPDGKKLLYSLAKDAKGEKVRLRVMDADGKNDKEMFDGNAMEGSFSPDGKRIVYLALPEKPMAFPSIYLADADGKNRKRLTMEEKAQNLSPRWSADGKGIYFSRFDGRGAQGAIYVMDADGKNPKMLSKAEKGRWDMLGGAGVLVVSFKFSLPPPKKE
jgi:Tol biopolymer transport system component